ncbi:MAG: DUF192 domain-containing protein [Microcoleaceae cyanobacterium]
MFYGNLKLARYSSWGLGLLLASCVATNSISTPEISPESNSVSTATPTTETLSEAPRETTGQMLPITAQAEIKGKTIELEVARTPEEQAMGLMFRENLPDNRGMLFTFDPPQAVGFWMKNCKISLDMIFIRIGVVQGIQVNAPPCIAEPCPTYGIETPIDQVIELRGKRSQELGLEAGDEVQVEYLQ